MFRNSIPIQNLKCGKCAAEIKSKLLRINNISNVLIHYDFSHISFNYKNANDLSNVENVLTEFGFPPLGEKIEINESNNFYCKDLSKKYCIYSEQKASIL